MFCRLSGGGAFQPYLSEGAGLRTAQEVLFSPVSDTKGDLKNTVFQIPLSNLFL